MKDKCLLKIFHYRGVPIVLIIILSLIHVVVYAQDIQMIWDNYMFSESALSAAVEKERLILDQLDRLQQDMTSLENHKSWFNGWFIEYFISKKSKKKIELSDSLTQLKEKKEFLIQERNKKFRVLKKFYLKLITSDRSDSLSLSDKRRAITIGNWIVGKGVHRIELPNYTSIVSNEYENEQVRQLIYSDLLSVIGKKVNQIDSLLLEWNRERELIARLEEFHRDLGLELESERDLNTRRSQLFDADTRKRGFFNEDADLHQGGMVTDLGNVAIDMSKSSKKPLSSSQLEAQIPLSTMTELSFGSSDIEENITVLEDKRKQYLKLMDQIKKELSQ